MYSPVNVHNPASRSHAALLHPGQQLRVTFSGVTIMEECKAHVQSDLVELSHETYADSGKTFVFKQKYDLEAWANVSTTFLGQVYFSGRGKVSPSVSMYLASTNECKRDIVTTVNPENQAIKLYPHQILEVVAYAPLWGQDLEWKCETDDHAALELLSDIRIDPTVYKTSESVRRLNDAFFTYPRMLEASGVPYLEYHWWYRWREMAANLAKSFDCPAVPMSFVGHVGGEIKMRQTIQVAINERAKDGWQEARSFQVTFEDSAMDKGRKEEDYTVQPFILPTLRSDEPLNRHPGKKRHHKNRSGRVHGHVVNPKQHHQSRHHDYKPYVKPFQARDVMVRLKPMRSLDEGCKVVSDDPIVPLPTVPALPAPHKAYNDYQGYSFRGTGKFNPPKAAYYYDGPDEQWD